MNSLNVLQCGIHLPYVYEAFPYVTGFTHIYVPPPVLGHGGGTQMSFIHSFIHSFIADIYIAPLQVGLLRSAPNSSAEE